MVDMTGNAVDSSCTTTFIHLPSPPLCTEAGGSWRTDNDLAIAIVGVLLSAFVGGVLY